jgi:hypothetical protein
MSHSVTVASATFSLRGSPGLQNIESKKQKIVAPSRDMQKSTNNSLDKRNVLLPEIAREVREDLPNRGNSHSLKKLVSSLPDGTDLLEMDSGSPMSHSVTVASASGSLRVSPMLQSIENNKRAVTAQPRYMHQSTKATRNGRNILSNGITHEAMSSLLPECRCKHSQVLGTKR